MATGTLTGQTIANTYKALLKITGTTAGGETLHATTQKVIEDGDGNPFPLSAAQDAIMITGTNRLEFNDAGEYISGDGTDLTITSGNDIILAVGSTGSVHSTGNAGTNNTVLGIDAGIGLESGSNYNVFIGDLTGDSSLNDAIWNVGVGYAALSSLTTGDRNTAVGYQALTTCSTGEENVAIGRGSLDAAVSASYNVAIGTNALGAVDDGETFNVAIGYDAMGNANHADIDGNIAIGGYTLDAIGANAQTGTIAIGHQALSALTSGAANTAVGYQALASVTTGQWNTAVGYQAADVLPAGADSNTAIGQGALGAGNNATCDKNTCLGDGAGGNITTGYKNTILGAASQPGGVDAINQTIVGYGVTTLDVDNSVVLGDSNVTDVYMAQDSGATVHCAGVNMSVLSHAGGMTSEILDDYEEGKYDITITGSTSGNYVLGTYNDIKYTKIGNLCHIQGYYGIDSDNSISGELQFSLPFTASSGTGADSDYGSGTIIMRDCGQSNIFNLTAQWAAGQAFFRVRFDDGDQSSSILDDGDTDASFSGWLGFSFTTA